jgi:hypothetical protein
MPSRTVLPAFSINVLVEDSAVSGNTALRGGVLVEGPVAERAAEALAP